MTDMDLDKMFSRRRGEPVAPKLTGYHDLLRQVRAADVALSSVPDAIIQTDHADAIVAANKAAETITGLAVEQLVGRRLDETLAFHEPGGAERTVPRSQPLPQGVFRVLRDAGGEERLVLVAVTTHTHGRVYVMRDATAGASAAGHDALTGLPDRQFLEQRLTEILGDRGRGPRQLLYLDLDQFKVVNDLCGHRAGDQLLQQLTRHWQAELEHGELLARLGGDEFCAVLARDDIDAAQAIGERLITLAQDLRFEWSGQVFRIGASAGLVDFAVAETADPLLAAADSACWAAKDNGRNRVHVFHPGDRELLARHEQMSWLSHIARAIDENRLVLHHQNIEALTTTQPGIPHCEILVRMVGDDGKLVAPEHFIPAAERFNLMPRLDRWVVEQVCIGIGRRQRADRRSAGTCAINLSGTTFNDPRFTEFVRECIIRHRVPRGAICFELTETAAIASLARAREFIDAMRALGCTIALDDFGSGVSSFAALKTLSIDFLKIDGSFVKNIHGDEVDRALVEAIQRVGEVMGIPTIAEFVEDDAVMEHLLDLGIQFAQGFALHRPEPWPWGPQFAAECVPA